MQPKRVLILVLMEYGLREKAIERGWEETNRVLILVLMEYGLRDDYSKHPYV